MTAEAVLIHRVRAQDGGAIESPDHPRTAGRTVECAANRTDAGRADVEPPFRAVGLHLAFRIVFVCAMIHSEREWFLSEEEDCQCRRRTYQRGHSHRLNRSG